MKKFIVLIFIFAIGLFSENSQKRYSHGDPSNFEQALLELINRARVNPIVEATLLEKLDTDYARSAKKRRKVFFEKLKEDFGVYPKAQPLAFHPALLESAQKHSQDMFTNGYLSHTNRKGKSPIDRGKLSGYTSGVAENLSGRAGNSMGELLHSHFALLLDYDNPRHSRHPFIHRNNLLNPRFTEIGIGISGNYELGKITENFGRSGTHTYILGVVYIDKNKNGFYDPGEGVEGVNVIPEFGNYYAVSSTSGGYAIPIEEQGGKIIEYPIELEGPKWTEEHKKIDEEFRVLALEKEEYQELLEITVRFESSLFPEPISKKISIQKPIKLDYKLVQKDGVKWGYHAENPLVIGKNYKLDLKLSQ